MKTALLIIPLILLAACSTPPRIKTPKGAVSANLYAGTPATLKADESRASIRIPSGSIASISRAAATPAIEQIKITFAADSEYVRDASALDASTGTIDTTVARHRIDAGERRILLYAAIAALFAGIVARAFLNLWPILYIGLFAASGVLFASWKFSEIPWWIAAAIAAVVLLLVAGYMRGERDAAPAATPPQPA